MHMTKIKERLQLAFTVFAMFFGAGNLIFPVFLAYSAGENIIPSFIGFALTAIGFPVLSLIAIGKSGSLERIGNRIHPVFSRIFTIVIYLSIGPCLAIPRTASTSFAMVGEAAGNQSVIFSALYSALFFALAGIIALHPERLTKTLGRILAPMLLVLIAVLFAGLCTAPSVYTPSSAEYARSPFAKGFTEGYQTMDAIAGLVFGTVLTLNLEALGKTGKEKDREGITASLGGGIILLAVYSILAFIGTKAELFTNNPSTGADILSGAVAYISASYGRILIAMIFVIACFNTSVGLLSSCGEYFTSLYPRISRKRWIFIFAVISAVIANAGLEMIIGISGPVLEIIYPGAITLTLLSLIPRSGNLHYTYILSTFSALLFSLLSMLGIALPLSGTGFEWLLPTLVFSAIGLLCDRKSLSARGI